jgi:hypothetical protein
MDLIVPVHAQMQAGGFVRTRVLAEASFVC